MRLLSSWLLVFHYTKSPYFDQEFPTALCPSRELRRYQLQRAAYRPSFSFTFASIPPLPPFHPTYPFPKSKTSKSNIPNSHQIHQQQTLTKLITLLYAPLLTQLLRPYPLLPSRFTKPQRQLLKPMEPLPLPLPLSLTLSQISRMELETINLADV